MKYALLIYTDETAGTDMTEEEIGAEVAAYGAFAGAASQRVDLQSGEALHPSANTTSVKVRDGQTLTTDGPFAETKEQLGGFYVIDAKDLDEAIEIAAMIPGALYGTVEVRPIVDFG